MGKVTRSRSRSIAELIRRLVAMRQANITVLSAYLPNYKRRIQHYEKGDRQINLDAFIDLMTGLRCEVIVVPLGNYGEWYRLNDFPDNEGNVLLMPEKVKKGSRKRRHE